MTEPLITNQSLFLKVRDKIDEIAETLHAFDNRNLGPGLMAGNSGIVLFLFYHARIFRNERSQNLAHHMLDAIMDEAQNYDGAQTFSDGMAGIGWLLGHLAENGFIDLDPEDTLSAIDQPLAWLMEQDLDSGIYDLLHGGIGYGMYFLQRFSHNGNPEYLRLLIGMIDRTAVEEDKGLISWYADIHLEEVIHGVNLGMAHGMPAIISFLSRIYMLGIEQEECTKLIRGAMRYLLKYRQDPGKYRSCYPGWVGQGTPAKSRLAWCYGDPGIGLAIIHAAKALEEQTWKQEYFKVFSNSAKRRSDQDDPVLDAGLCHGSAGLVQIFNHVYQLTREPLFQEAAGHWLLRTLELASYHDGMAGYKVYRPSVPGKRLTDPGLLEGVAGIGLALMSSITHSNSRWDECLMIH